MKETLTICLTMVALAYLGVRLVEVDRQRFVDACMVKGGSAAECVIMERATR